MQDLLIPSGHVEFQGDLEALLHTISRIDGTLLDRQRFRCVFRFPKPANGIRFGSPKGLRLSFVFRCGYEVAEKGFRVSYRVYPSLLDQLLLAAPLVFAVAGIVRALTEGGGLVGLVLGLLLGVVIYPTSFLVRKNCIRRFLDAFEAKS